MIFFRRSLNKKAKLHDDTPQIVLCVGMLFDELCIKCSAKPKVKKCYCYMKVLPLVMEIKSDMMTLYDFAPKNNDGIQRKLEMMDDINLIEKR